MRETRLWVVQATTHRLGTKEVSVAADNAIAAVRLAARRLTNYEDVFVTSVKLHGAVVTGGD